MNHIPKIIHYCWFGGKPLPELAQKCIASWKKYCPDYEIREWNESNIDLSSVDYMREAYEEKVWGFVPDVARLQIIYNNGGIYLDTDVEIIRPITELISNAFIGIEEGGSEGEYYVNLGLGFGAEKGNELIGYLLDDYSKRHFRNDDGTLDRTPSPCIQTRALIQRGFSPKNSMQEVSGVTIYPMEYFCPLSYRTGVTNITKNTYSIHHYNASWLTNSEKYITKMHQQICRHWGALAEIIWPLVRFKYEIKRVGIWEAFQIGMRKFKNRNRNT